MKSGSQNYEKYWKITLEYTNINGERFIGTLRVIVDFINKHKDEPYSPKLFNQLQERVYDFYPKEDMGSVRKSINQFAKLGFIFSKLRGYNEETINFLNSRNDRQRESIFSKIVYSYSSFNRSISNESNQNQVSFLIKTLEKVGSLTKEDIVALMITDITNFPKGFLAKEELAEAREKAKKIGFIERKYNQAGHFHTVLTRLDDLTFREGVLYFEDDAKEIFGDSEKEKAIGRDVYLQRLYKNQLKEESIEKMGGVKCMLEGLSYPRLIASHIKPFIVSSKEEAYDPNNGLLLSQNTDGLFDSGLISFEDNGAILISKILPENVQNNLKKLSLHKKFLNEKRIIYLKYHREKKFKTN